MKFSRPEGMSDKDWADAFKKMDKEFRWGKGGTAFVTTKPKDNKFHGIKEASPKMD